VNVRKKRPIYLRAAKENILKNRVPNLINDDFNTDQPLSKLSADVSYITCLDGRLYLSAVKDMFNNEIISYSTSNRNDTDLVMESFRKLPKANKYSIIHTDQGSTYLSYDTINLVESKGYTRSMSKRGCCWQNSPIENWFSQYKEESLRNGKRLTMKEVKYQIKKYVQWYNNERIQKDLDYLTPIEYKNRFI
jgi:transposase InsO family protein